METQTSPRKLLPLGIQSLREILEGGYYYVDKTPMALQLVHEGKYYFLSRPRRFGKSLFLDTLKELFEGNQTLFKGLYAENNWDWSKQYPVIRLDLGLEQCQSRQEMDAMIAKQLQAFESPLGIVPQFPAHGLRLQDIIKKTYQQKGQQVVVLVDEYDKPILDNLLKSDIAREMRDVLRGMFVGLKSLDGILRFIFMTGVSKFSKVSIFSGLNNLDDITLSPRYSAICGYTDQDVDTVFAPELAGLDREKIRDWYNGYNWRGTPVYNPFDLLKLFREREFKSFWFETGTPAFLVDFLTRRQWFTPEMLALQTSDTILSRFDVDDISTEAMLWQTGYLTLHKVEQSRAGNWRYTLGYPNREVESALNDFLLPAYGPQPQEAFRARSQVEEALYQHDLPAIQSAFQRLFASIPNDWYRNNPLAKYEGYYASVFYTFLAALGLSVQGEDVTNLGRIDLSLKLENQVYLFEFKVVDTEPEGKALQQLIEQGYADKYRGTRSLSGAEVSITLIGVEFSRQSRNIVGWDVLELA